MRVREISSPTIGGKTLAVKGIESRQLGGRGDGEASGIGDEPPPEQELDALSIAFRERSAQEARRFRDATDSEHWVCVCFTSREEKEAFLRAANLAKLGDKYLDGRKVARALGVAID